MKTCENERAQPARRTCAWNARANAQRQMRARTRGQNVREERTRGRTWSNDERQQTRKMKTWCVQRAGKGCVKVWWGVGNLKVCGKRWVVNVCKGNPVKVNKIKGGRQTVGSVCMWGQAKWEKCKMCVKGKTCV